MKNPKILVIGGGVIGLFNAWILKENGYEVILIDKSDFGAGASSAALGNLTPYSDHDVTAATSKLAEKSLALYPNYIQKLEHDCDCNIEYRSNGLLEIAFDKEHADKIFNLYSNNFKNNSNIYWCDSKDIKNIERNVSHKALSAIFYKTEASLNVKNLLNALIKKNITVGNLLIDNETVYKIEKNTNSKFQTFTKNRWAHSSTKCNTSKGLKKQVVWGSESQTLARSVI